MTERERLSVYLSSLEQEERGVLEEIAEEVNRRLDGA